MKSILIIKTITEALTEKEKGFLVLMSSIFDTQINDEDQTQLIKIMRKYT